MCLKEIHNRNLALIVPTMVAYMKEWVRRFARIPAASSAPPARP